MTDDASDLVEQKALKDRLTQFRNVTRLIEKVGYVAAFSAAIAFAGAFISGGLENHTGSMASAPYIPKKMRQIHHPGSEEFQRPSRSQLEARFGLIDKIAGNAPSNLTEAQKVYLRAQICSYRTVQNIGIECSPLEDTKWLVSHGNEVIEFANPVIMGILEEMHLGGLKSVITADIAKARQDSRFEVRKAFSNALSKVSYLVIFPMLLLGFSFMRFFRMEVINHHLSPWGAELKSYSHSLMERLALGTHAWFVKQLPSARNQEV